MKQDPISGYKQVNGLRMYYQIHGQGSPLVLIHGGGSTIYTTFGQVLPLFARHRQVIAMELQAHGHTPDRDRPSSFEQDADDVAALLEELQIKNADIFGFSNGGQTAMQLAIRHPGKVHKLIVAAAGYKREGYYPWFWEFLSGATMDAMPQPLKDAYLAINADQKALQAMHDRDYNRMIDLVDWSDDLIRSIQAPTFVISGDRDVVTTEHALELYRLLPKARLLIYPGVHGDFIGELCVGNGILSPRASVEMIEEFLDQDVQ
ncbi:MAG: alpha/beta fold hydrolase [Mucilaginibacter sp.]|nr:alpha/beta fold hydrolase [Mucilaginibacter sp.]